MSLDPLLDDLSAEQLAAVTEHPEAPVAIWAGAGSGKTRVLTRRIAFRTREQSALSRHIVAVTFTRKAAEELRVRLKTLDPTSEIVAGTFHAIAYAQLRRWYSDHDKTIPALITSRRSFITRNCADLAQSIDLDNVLPLIDWARARMLSTAAFEKEMPYRDNSILPSEIPRIAALYQQYEHEKRQRHVIDFDDLLQKTAKLLTEDADFGAAQRWRFRHFFVDEVQDINPGQIALLNAWLGDRTDVCAVGDANQAIYGWNGADSSFLRNFENLYSDARVLRLIDNYRSTPNILSMAHAALEVANNSHLAVREAGSDPTLTSYEDDKEEIQRVVDGVEAARAGGLLFTDIAILARTNAQLEPFARELRRRGVPVRVRTRDKDRERALRGVLNGWKESMPEASPQQAFTRWIDAHQDNEAGAAFADELDELIAEFAAIDPAGTTRAFADWLSVATTFDEPTEPGVEILTFHKAKGLEWHTVFVVGLENGYVPIISGDLEEERRLLYVALTRATDALHCSWANMRSFGSHLTTRDPSPFLIRITAPAMRATATSDWRESVAEARARLRTLRSPGA